MELTSPIFFFSLAVLFLLHWLSPHRWRALWLLGGSYLLYALWDLRYIYVLIGSTLLDFGLALLLDRSANPARRRLLLVLSLASNLGILGFFKYTNFFLGLLPGALPPLHLFVPLGVSFYTFHSISYIVDIYRRRITPCRSLIDYALYVSFFPKLISGPIERTEHFLGQLQRRRFLRAPVFAEAIERLLYGLFLKLAVGDRLHYLTDRVFDHAADVSRVELWLGFYGYSFQIYADFFGYTLMAQGAALLFGIRLSDNFLHPYWSATPQEFWRRWHVSLSSWFRDYLYIPLGGGRRHVVLNLMVTMAMAGLWHGADLKFVFWGLFHGALVSLQRIFAGSRLELRGAARWLGVLVTFHLVSFGWLFFRAADFRAAMAFAGRMWAAPWPAAGVFLPEVKWGLALLAAWGLVIGARRLLAAMPVAPLGERVQWTLPARGLVLGVVLLLIAVMGATNAEPFVYFYF